MMKIKHTNLNHSKTLLKLIANNTTNAVFAIDLEGNLTFANSKCLSILGHKAEIDLVGKNIHTLIHYKRENNSPHSDIEYPIYQSLYDSNEVHISDEYFMNANGVAINTKCWSYSIINDNTITGAVIFFNVNTSHNQNEAGKIQDLEKYSLSTKVANDIIWDWKISTDKINRTGEGLNLFFGHETKNINNQFLHWTKLIHPDDFIRINASLNIAFSNIECLYWEHDFRFLKADGQYAFVNDKALIIRDKKGKVKRLIGVMKDTSEFENRIRLIIEDQNKKLEEIRWIQSHVVRAPLSRMMGIVNILKETKLNTIEFQGWVNHFVNSSKELDSIIHDITNKAADTELKI